jgi:UDP-N-acetylmuramoyl-tripeptide--D-alanyl-D-alanine ligase
VTGTPKLTARLRRIKILSFILLPFMLFLPIAAISLAVILLSPIEFLIKRHYLQKAVKILDKRPNLIRIGITGSFGKTSCKNILNQILSSQYTVTASRESFNTPMGFAKTVNEDLKPDTEILIMEMGAKHIGDIRQLCKLLRPDYGIITGIGPQHLETFQTLENIRKTKYEIASFCPIIDNPTKEVFNTTLLGRHNQKNISLCAELARKLYVTEDNILSAIRNLRQTPHRLELIQLPNDKKIIDDSYNSNPVSAMAALDVLSTFNGIKLVQTPGFVEQGENAYNANRELGKQIADVTDNLIIVGELNKTAIADGFGKKYMYAKNRDEAKRYYEDFDVLLIVNDIPDNY